ncbi:hypothetical protein [Vulcanisaeta souniana]|uniref:Uncharacterized protein n=1 Tax=Vulcanisaeta souniana JCM 11219 TaxID=1293586 RepID=A0ABN6SM72_9CREN|nr:hypothetical protein [Vulcanisaeta souniana]BDR91056.1 hypothetical protein Vsou_01490 [Vulcanisaeta souniana JCM 11219]
MLRNERYQALTPRGYREGTFGQMHVPDTLVWETLWVGDYIKHVFR